MEEGIPLLRDLVILIAVAIPVVILAQKFRIPSLVGFLLAGIVTGPHALGLVQHPDEVRTLAEVGAVLLLFSIGLELSVSTIIRLGRYVVRGGAGQVIGTLLVVAAVALAAGAPINRAVLAGALVALSSTAVILKVYADRGELDSAHGRVVVGILLFQDLCVVPFMIMMPLLAGAGEGVNSVLAAIATAAAAILVLGFAGRLIVPRALEKVAELRNPEIFTLCVLGIGLSAAWLTSLFGLSLALGAFIAGLLIAESEYGLQALSDVLPFKDTFSGIFFISVGMLLDVEFVASHPFLVFGAALAIVAVKSVVGFLVVRMVRRSARVGWIAGIGLAQIGEFSFVLAAMASTLGLVTGAEYQLFLGAAILTMLAAPFAVNAAPEITDRFLRHRTTMTMEFATREARAVKPLAGHVIIVGYGLNGQNLARVLRRNGIPYVVLDSNGHKVRMARLEREPIFFGDGTRGEVLERVGIKRAKMIVFAIASLADERRGVSVARHLNAELHIVARTRYVKEIEELRRLGANEVVPEEFETSLEILARVLRRYDVPADKIRVAAEDARRDHYEILRERGTAHTRVDHLVMSTEYDG